jgi:hypothetical protein
VADHPLRPATDRRLGGPLPHQLPNPTRAPLSAMNLSSSPSTSGISPGFPGLSRTERQVPTRYSPVRHSRIAAGVRLACVRPAASVRSEPGSNSQVDCPKPSGPGRDPVRTNTHSCASDERSPPQTPRLNTQRPAKTAAAAHASLPQTTMSKNQSRQQPPAGGGL